MGIDAVLGQPRASLILLHPTSLPDPPGRAYGVGELGSEAFRFIDLLHESNTLAWQTLPLGHTGYKDSPYQTFSRYAGSPLLISVERLFETRDLTREQHDAYCDSVRAAGLSAEKVPYGWLFIHKLGADFNDSNAILRQAHDNFSRRPDNDPRRQAYASFRDAAWLDNYAEYMALKELHQHQAWPQWPAAYRDIHAWRAHRQEHLTESPQLARAIDFYKYLQFIFFSQWETLRRYARDKKRLLIGDIPWYVGHDSADIWAQPEVFDLDAEGMPNNVAGVPPDAFSDTGQLWGNPLYDWTRPEAIDWWADSTAHILGMVDILRLDHVRAADTYWSVTRQWAETEATALEGHWEKGPGEKLLVAIRQALENNKQIAPGAQLPIIAEDLGCFDPLYASLDEYPDDISAKHRYPLSPAFSALLRAGDIDQAPGLDPATGEYSTRRGIDILLDRHELPPMRVLQFELEGGRPFDPAAQSPNTTLYTGTHDNPTTLSWYRDTVTAENARRDAPETGHGLRARVRSGLGLAPPAPTEENNDKIVVRELLEAVWKTKASLAGAPLQDILALGEEARMNLPGDAHHPWWAWRVSREAFQFRDIVHLLSELNRKYERFPERRSTLRRPPQLAASDAAIRRLILKNRSYRRFYENNPVDAQTLRSLVDLARLSPSAANLQPLKFILVREPETNARVFSTLSWAAYLSDWSAPPDGQRPSAYIILLHDKNISEKIGCDHGIAAQSILLGAVANGLGGCMIGSIDRPRLRQTLDIPKHLEIALVVALGHPREEVILEPLETEGDIRYWRDIHNIHHVPKRALDDIILEPNKQ